MDSDHQKSPSHRSLIAGALCLLAAYWLYRISVLPVYRLDFEILLQASRRMLEGESQYQLAELAENTKPPLAAWMLQWALGLTNPVRGWMLDFFQVVSVALLGRTLLSSAGGASTFEKLLAGWGLAYGLWLTETLLGQYNVLLVSLLACTGLTLFQQAQRGFFLGAGIGLVACIEVMFKPTQLLMLPWLVLPVLLQPSDSRSALRMWGGMLLAPLLLATGYAAQFGFSRLVSDHLDWLSSVGQSEAKHILLFKNFGIPGWLSRQWGYAPWLTQASLATGLLAVGLWIWRKESPYSRRGLFVASAAALLVSPMAWKQNATPMFLILAWEAVRSRIALRKLSIPIVLMLVFQLVNIDTVGEDFYRTYGNSGLGTLVLISILMAGVWSWPSGVGSRSLPE